MDFFDCPTDGWLDAYWTILCVFFIFVLASITWALIVLLRRGDRRNRRIATVYVAACIASIFACALPAEPVAPFWHFIRRTQNRNPIRQAMSACTPALFR